MCCYVLQQQKQLAGSCYITGKRNGWNDFWKGKRRREKEKRKEEEKEREKERKRKRRESCE